MADDNLDLTGVIARLAKLETQNRRFKKAGAIAILAGAAVLAMAEARPPGVERAASFVVVGPDGAAAAVLGYKGGFGAPRLTFGPD